MSSVLLRDVLTSMRHLADDFELYDAIARQVVEVLELPAEDQIPALHELLSNILYITHCPNCHERKPVPGVTFGPYCSAECWQAANDAQLEIEADRAAENGSYNFRMRG